MQLDVDMLSCVIAEGSKGISITTGTVFTDRCFQVDRREGDAVVPVPKLKHDT